jgi:predicted TIM-barrel fold metal-dependent hydrolase
MYKIFSVDDHLIEPPDVWSSRVPAKMHDAAPHVIADGGREFWVFEDRRSLTMGLNAVAGLPRERWNSEPATYADMIPGSFDPKARAMDLLSQGVLASVGFPTLPRFGGMLFNEFKDKELAAVCVRAWNDFVLDEWCPSGPEGFYVPLIIVPVWDPVLAAAEVRRCAALGARAVAFPEHPSPGGLPGFRSDTWDPFWDAMQDTGLVLCLHIGSSGRMVCFDPDFAHLDAVAVAHINAMGSFTELVMSPVCQKFPDLKIAYSEGGVGWIPAVLERCDRQWERNVWTGRTGRTPSEIYQRNIFSCMVEEPIGFSLYPLIGEDKIFAEVDYPHSDSPFPRTQGGLERVFAGTPDDVVAKVTYRNAERVFNWKMADEALLERDDVVAWRDELARNPYAAMDRRHGIDGIPQIEADAGRCTAMFQNGVSFDRCGKPLNELGECPDGHVQGVVLIRAAR